MAEADGRTFQTISERAGYHANSISALRRGRKVSFTMVADLGEVLGYELKWVKK